MALTREFKETVMARLDQDPAFRAALLSDAVELLLEGDLETGKSVLRDFINATIGFETLAEKVDMPAKSLMRMFGPKGNPRADNLFNVIRQLQESSGIHLAVAAA
ncbi:Putative addiction module antidote protein [Neorhizobium galegae bv. officinalis bv. officinalis str. HAMBI 1141]|uniref:Putative addiction module antidote protein n=1 Tax=Neorhizobium galegae bv. officinalis bv. officinalis str. HAMBI 1141 TaxID=1028801 RepID=A0A068T6G7_NEOGA|nr:MULTISPECIES: transcriptional regulator [Neorhizobium]MCJ9671331.1 transcriptional regulator [Neorhizobium sp. SHOUNA12B]MCJ9745672.1 transcriptional regulator [Neorhizobium sp. SHOUNA12A]CDN52880.1 Putative addiction module antidote protein [Neorhizobium galegae bv. officinalis bv. officinalis str. HAMBI 1141]